jgi:hypothetical protein
VANPGRRNVALVVDRRVGDHNARDLRHRLLDATLRTSRRKGSRVNRVEWTPRLRAAWDGALALHRAIMSRQKRPKAIRPEQRVVIVSESGEPLNRSSLDATWQRFFNHATAAGVIAPQQRFGIHDPKRKGGTDTAGSRADKQDALGVFKAMTAVYDRSVPRVRLSR